MKGNVFNIQRFCLHDGPGIRTTVFLKGCPLSCIWCHNPESRSCRPQLLFRQDKCIGCTSCAEVGCKAISIDGTKVLYEREKCTDCGRCAEKCLTGARELCGSAMSCEEVLSAVLRDKRFYERSGGGMTVSGGEPSYQPDFTLELIKTAAQNGVSLAIETAGCGAKEFYSSANDLGAVFLFDLKCGSKEKHKALVGIEQDAVLENLRYLCRINAEIIIRMPLVPDVNDSEEDISGLCNILSEIKGSYRYAEIMPYHDLGIAKSVALGDDYQLFSSGRDKALIWKKQFLISDFDVRISL